MDVIKTKLPDTREPFVNTYLHAAGVDEATGEERFWISSYNCVTGTLGVLVTKSGKCKYFRYEGIECFYAAAYAGDNKMWLCGWTDKLHCLDLNTGAFDTYETGIDSFLTFSGMCYDPATKTIFGGTFFPKTMRFIAYCFDTVSKKTIKKFDEKYVDRGSYFYTVYPKDDGTYYLLTRIPHTAFLHWDPANLTLTGLDGVIRHEKGDNRGNAGRIMEEGRIYVRGKGWFDPTDGSYAERRKPEREAAWFGAYGDYYYGTNSAHLGGSEILAWDTRDGTVATIAELPDCMALHLNITADGMIICVNKYGFLYIVDPVSKTIVNSQKLKAESVNWIDCVLKIDEDRVLVTPFITQRFCEINLKTGVSEDLGRATGGGGEVLVAERIGEKIYMASYTEGELVEYDPGERAYFPENPRTVVLPPAGTQRPVGHCIRNGALIYSCSKKYGTLGAVMVKYDPSAGSTIFADDPIGKFIVHSLFYDDGTDTVVSGSEINTEGKSIDPSEKNAVLAIYDPDTLACLHKIEPPVPGHATFILGKLAAGAYLFTVHGDNVPDGYGVLDIKTRAATMETPKYAAFLDKLPKFTDKPDKKPELHYTGETGKFIILHGDGVDLWDLHKMEKIKQICDKNRFYRLVASGGDLFGVVKDDLYIYRNFM